MYFKKGVYINLITSELLLLTSGGMKSRFLLVFKDDSLQGLHLVYKYTSESSKLQFWLSQCEYLSELENSFDKILSKISK